MKKYDQETQFLILYKGLTSAFLLVQNESDRPPHGFYSSRADVAIRGDISEK